MTRLQQYAEDYLRLRRSLGFDLGEQHRLLPRFVSYLDQAGIGYITIAVALVWSLMPRVMPPISVTATRYRAVRGFARYMSGIDRRTEIPPAGLIPRRSRWRPPFIYTDEDVLAIIDEVRRSIPQPLRAATYETLIGLLASCGLRVGEALRLDRADLDWAEGLLHVRRSKFRESRLVPLAQHPGGVGALRAPTRPAVPRSGQRELLRLAAKPA